VASFRVRRAARGASSVARTNTKQQIVTFLAIVSSERIWKKQAIRRPHASWLAKKSTSDTLDRTPNLEASMKRVVAALMLSAITILPVYAQTCATQAMSKDGKPLSGAAKTSFVKKCCEDSAVSKDGKPLHGAAKTSYVKKCAKG
jgi:hypothetical protein